jgi:hypothetical protein
LVSVHISDSTGKRDPESRTDTPRTCQDFQRGGDVVRGGGAFSSAGAVDVPGAVGGIAVTDIEEQANWRLETLIAEKHILALLNKSRQRL